jgi:lipopolysaccharide export system protein LptC
MFNRLTILFPLILAAFLAFITFWINTSVEQQVLKANGSNRHASDYMMENFVTTQTDPAGNLKYTLAAEKMTHYPDDDSTVLEQPQFTQYAINKPYTKIEGKHGNVSSNGEEIEILEDVIVVREASAAHGEMRVLTDKLIIFPNQNLAKTDRPVVINQAPKTVIHATGLIYDKRKKTIQLLNKVNAHYEKPNK